MQRIFKRFYRSTSTTQEVEDKSNQSIMLQNTSDVCRICYDCIGNDLNFYCDCNGSHAFAHKPCLKSWLSEKFPKLEDAHCEICKKAYKLRIIYSIKYQKPNSEDQQICVYCKFFVLILLLIIMTCITAIVFKFNVDFKNNYAYSISIILACVIPLALNIGIILKVFITNYFLKIVKGWDLCNRV
jgi:hypothetical protein